MQDDQNTQPTPEPVTEPATPTEEKSVPVTEPVDEEVITGETDSDDTIESDETLTKTHVIEASTNDDDDEEETPSRKANTSKALDIMQIENMINTQMVDIDKKRDEVKMLKDSYEDAFKNDAKFREFDDKVKEANRLKTTYKQAMLKDPSIAQANSKFLVEKDELKDMQMALSDYLKEYNRVTGLSQFETADGTMLEIIQTFKLVKK